MNSDDDSSDSSPAPSPSPPASPNLSTLQQTAPNVEQLLQYFVSAKRSLSSTSYVFRANELVNTSRTLVEEIAVLNARNAFTERAVNEQVDTLYQIKDEVEREGSGVGDEFEVTIRKLDLANDRLERTLGQLRGMVVEVGLGRNDTNGDKAVNNSEEDDGEDSQVETEEQEQKTLYDFIDETNHTTLQSSLRQLIDSFNDARADLESSINLFSDTLITITNTVANKTTSTAAEAEPPDISKVYDEPPQPTSHLFKSMEDHAAEMAKLLESLVSHYDLCVTALKHTEGGGEAARRAIQQADELLAPSEQQTTGTAGVEESLYNLKAVQRESMPAEEKREMLHILANDAAEVDDVVTEIRDRNADQESQFSLLSNRVSASRTKSQALSQVLEMLHEIRDIHLPSHLHALGTFKASWKRIQGSIASQTAELVELSSFYDGFLSGYAKLLREVERRRAAEDKMRKVAEKARRDLEKMYQADRELRSEFMEDTGKYLPQGIWAGLMDEGVRYDIHAISPTT